MNIISLVPSISELLYDLSLEKETVGVTKFCIYPDHWRKKKEIIGGTKNINIEKIESLNPSLIIANKEENIKEQIEACAAFSEILLTDVNTYENGLEMIALIGSKTERKKQAVIIKEQIESAFATLHFEKELSAIYLIWKNPIMAVGGDSFIHSMMEKAGFKNLLENEKRYPEISEEKISALKPNLIMLSTEPFPFGAKEKKAFQEQFPESKVIIVDGTFFSWYGSRMLGAATYFKNLRKEIDNLK